MTSSLHLRSWSQFPFGQASRSSLSLSLRLTSKSTDPPTGPVLRTQTFWFSKVSCYAVTWLRVPLVHLQVVWFTSYGKKRDPILAETSSLTLNSWSTTGFIRPVSLWESKISLQARARWMRSEIPWLRSRLRYRRSSRTHRSGSWSNNLVRTWWRVSSLKWTESWTKPVTTLVRLPWEISSLGTDLSQWLLLDPRDLI